MFAMIFFIGCQLQTSISDTCESRTIAAAIRFKAQNIPHQIAVGKDHVAIQVFKGKEWEFFYLKDKQYIYIEYVTLQDYMEYLVAYYNALDILESIK